MSALGQKQTLRHFQLMSALPPKADIESQPWNVRFVPKADITQCSNRGQPLLQVLTNFRQQLAGTKRFRHIIIAARGSRLLFLTTERIGGDSYDRDRS